MNRVCANGIRRPNLLFGGRVLAMFDSAHRIWFTTEHGLQLGWCYRVITLCCCGTAVVGFSDSLISPFEHTGHHHPVGPNNAGPPMPLTSTIDTICVPLSRVSGSLLRHTR